MACFLGLSYIWIDSLCIVQDGVEDWRLKSSLMSSVYGNSSLNIAASGAIDGSYGCFFRRSGSWRCQVKIPSSQKQSVYECVPFVMYFRSMSEMPLPQRGWAFQERLLPSRTLHFTSTQVFWECYHKVACETFPSQFPTSLAYTSCHFKNSQYQDRCEVG